MSLFKRKDTSFEDMDSQEKLRKIMDQLGFLEKKIDSVLEELRGRGGNRQFGNNNNRGGRDFGRDRGGFRGGNRHSNNGGNTRYAGQGPQRYSGGRSFGDENRGNFGGRNEGGMRGGNRHQGRRPHPQHHQNPNAAAPAPQAASEEAQPE